VGGEGATPGHSAVDFFDGILFPTAFTATTVARYLTEGFKPERRHDVADVAVHVEPAGTDETTYSEIGEPPSEDGASQTNSAAPPLGVPAKPVGDVGTVAGVTAGEA